MEKNNNSSKVLVDTVAKNSFRILVFCSVSPTFKPQILVLCFSSPHWSGTTGLGPVTTNNTRTTTTTAAIYTATTTTSHTTPSTFTTITNTITTTAAFVFTTASFIFSYATTSYYSITTAICLTVITMSLC